MLTLSRKLLFIILLLGSSLAISAEEDQKTAPGMNEGSLKGLEWRNVGPALMSGQGLGGWRALERAYRDFLAGETGPAPDDL